MVPVLLQLSITDELTRGAAWRMACYGWCWVCQHFRRQLRQCSTDWWSRVSTSLAWLMAVQYLMTWTVSTDSSPLLSSLMFVSCRQTDRQTDRERDTHTHTQSTVCSAVVCDWISQLPGRLSGVSYAAQCWINSYLIQLNGSVKEPNISIYLFFPPITQWCSISDVLFTGERGVSDFSVLKYY